MGRKLKILVDMDDVLEDLLGGWLCWLNNKYNLSINKKDITEWSMRNCINKYMKECMQFPNTQFTDEQIYEPLYDKKFWSTLTPLPGSVDGLKVLNEMHDVYIATASHYKTIEAKVEKCLFKYFPYLNWNQIITISDKSMLNGDILIDDRYENIKDFADIANKRYGILVTAPYNKDIDINNSSIRRASNWMEIMYFIGEISNK